jgi:HEAT repeat protein
MGTAMISAIDDLRPFLVKILRPDSDQVNGTGFLCDPEGYVLTAYHVILPYVRSNRTEIRIHYKDHLGTGMLRRELSTAENDVAVIKLSDGPENPLWLMLDAHRRRRFESRFISFGYPVGSFVEHGIDIKGTIGAPTAIDDTDAGPIEILSLEGLRLGNLDGGYSGAPILDCRTQKVIGLVYAKDQASQAFCIPIDKIFQIWPAERTRVHDVYQHIREHLARESRQELERKLDSKPPIPLNLEAGVIPKKEERQASEEARATSNHGREWATIDVKTQLLPPSGRYILSSDVGTGKTTFLRWLAAELVKTTQTAPIFMPLHVLEDIPANSWADLEDELVRTYKDQFVDADVRDFLETHYSEGRVVFLFDALDQIKKSPNYSDLADRAFRISDGKPCIISSRPTAVLVYEEQPEITFLRLSPFSISDQRSYFGSDYAEAQRISSFAPDLVRIPILAFVVRTLIGKKRAERIRTRTDAYEEFFRYIRAEHEPHRTLYVERGDSWRDIEESLKELSYEALAADQPRIQRIEDSFYYDNIPREQRAKLEDLPKFGLVNLILDRTEAKLIYFTHHSFQEFLAAKYVAEPKHEYERNRVLAERWNPKWEEVIKFLVGLKGEEIIKKIYARDNSIHAPLFLAAKCFSETILVSPHLRDELCRRLTELCHQTPFCEDALEALVKGCSAAEVVPLLDDANAEVKAAATNVLCSVCEQLAPEHLNALVAKLEDANSHRSGVREAAIKVIQTVHEPLAPEILIALAASYTGGATEALNAAVKQLTPAHACTLIERLRDLDGKGRPEIARILIALPKHLVSDHLTALVDMLDDPIQKGVRNAAIEILGKRLDDLPPDQVSALIAKLHDADVEVRSAAVEVLRMLQRSNSSRLELSENDFVALINELDNPDQEVRRAAITALDKTCCQQRNELSRGKLAVLIAKLGHPDVDVRQLIKHFLGDVATDMERPHMTALVTKLNDPDERVREAAAQVLSDAAERLSPDHIEALIAKLDDSDEQARKAVISALRNAAEWLSPDHISALITRLDDTDEHVRMAAVSVLSQIGKQLSPNYIGALITKLKHPDEHVRRATIEVLAGCVPGSAAPHKHLHALVPCLEDPDREVRSAARSVLVQSAQRLAPDDLTKLLAWLARSDGFSYSEWQSSEWEASQMIKRLCDTGQQRPDHLLALVALTDRPSNWDSRYHETTEGLYALGKQLETEHISAVISRIERSVNACFVLGTVVVERVAPDDLSRLIAMLDLPLGFAARASAAIVLKGAGNLLTREQLEACLAKLDCEWHTVQEAMVAALGTAGRHPANAWVVPKIEAYLSHEHAYARLTAYQTLMHLYRSGVPLTATGGAEKQEALA